MDNKHSQNSTDSQDYLSGGGFMLSQLLPPIGFFLYFKYRKQFPNKARKALTGALVGIPIAVIAGYIMNNFILN